MKNRSVLHILNDASARLRKAGVRNARCECEMILCNVTGCEKRADLYLSSIIINERQVRKIEKMIIARMNRMPIQYILNEAEFMGRRLAVRPGVFIPRPETEILVDEAIKLANNGLPSIINILDIGTGSGGIAISLALSLTKSISRCKIIGLDISKRALSLARENAALHGITKDVRFVRSNIFNAIKNWRVKFDIIVSNPPYIASREVGRLQKEVLFEPRAALDGRKDGLYYYRVIIDQAPKYLKPGGYLVMELGFGQAQKVMDMISERGSLSFLRIIADYSGIDRVIIAKREARV